MSVERNPGRGTSGFIPRKKANPLAGINFRSAQDEAEVAYEALLLAIEQQKSPETVISAALCSIAAELRATRKRIVG